MFGFLVQYFNIPYGFSQASCLCQSQSKWKQEASTSTQYLMRTCGKLEQKCCCTIEKLYSKRLAYDELKAQATSYNNKVKYQRLVDWNIVEIIIANEFKWKITTERSPVFRLELFTKIAYNITSEEWKRLFVAAYSLRRCVLYVSFMSMRIWTRACKRTYNTMQRLKQANGK